MTYSFTPGQYDPVEQTDIVPEQEKSNQRICLLYTSPSPRDS